MFPPALDREHRIRNARAAGLRMGGSASSIVRRRILTRTAAKASFLLRNSAVASPDALKPALARCVCDMLSASHLVGAPRMSCSASFTMSRSASPVLRRTRARRRLRELGTAQECSIAKLTSQQLVQSLDLLSRCRHLRTPLAGMRDSFTRRSIT